MKRILLIGLCLLLLALPLTTALVGIAHPKPKELELLAGEEGRFEWAIQAIDEKEDLNCRVVVENSNSNLNIEYDEGEDFVVVADSIRPVFASVTPVAGTPDGRYEQDFCVECAPLGRNEGVSVLPRFCTPSVIVEVVTVRTRNNYPVPPKAEPSSNNEGILAGIGIAVLVIVAGLAWLRKPKKNKRKRKNARR